MWGLEDKPLPIRLGIAIIADVIDALNIIPGVGDLIETPFNAFIAYALTDNPKAAVVGGVDGILPAPIDWFPSATVMVIADELGWI
ncbi:hypothetical membrane protein [Thermococcus kodakarensis KOD1]|uniref:Hypothetical membrane protein n=1 Tax=Thermococcus kodakarensis (strain ATCC BAA-918 / JCM 12380 / KOD1) TaxID=69014 RepID=Q5JEH7_THEKO|nr:hypothetical protein [Thermococcus kodakarensis]WCN28192.1 hypothetical protein POG15_00420 [Thermococcus kodakarensis]WCN30489.1 hypothetical protein POG21_00420 [Thermococcus kodakarensis]BAD84267.1 hypothetical membrane protein [Thermococcus kodakarensis KOD1]